MILVHLPPDIHIAGEGTQEAIYLPIEAIKAIRRSVARDIAQDFQKFLEERYA